MRINPKSTHLYGVWFVAGRDRDWLGAIELVEGRWRFTYRFRYYSDAESRYPFSADDKKNWYAFAAKDGSTEQRDKMRVATDMVFKAAEVEFDAKGESFIFDCPPEEPRVFFELGSRPWFHIKKMTAEQAVEALKSGGDAIR